MARLFTVSATPHLRDRATIPKIMWSVVASLVPALAGAVYFFGLDALLIVGLTVAACVVSEGLVQKLAGKPITILDGSAVVTGILLAFNLPGGVPWWIPVIGGVFAVLVGKLIFGGLGYNPINPALLARVFLLISWPVQMTATWTLPRGVDAATAATPLSVMKTNMAILKDQVQDPGIGVAALTNIDQLNDSYWELFIGRVSGSIGETSVLFLLIGAAFLMYKRYIDWRIPLSFIGTTALLTAVFGGYSGLFTGPWLFHLLSGGLMLGAFFMATDMVTSPVTPKGQVIFGIGCGVLTAIIRIYGGYPEGVSFAIIFMNLAVPLINRHTRPKVFGGKKTR